MFNSNSFVKINKLANNWYSCHGSDTWNLLCPTRIFNIVIRTMCPTLSFAFIVVMQFPSFCILDQISRKSRRKLKVHFEVCWFRSSWYHIQRNSLVQRLPIKQHHFIWGTAHGGKPKYFHDYCASNCSSSNKESLDTQTDYLYFEETANGGKPKYFHDYCVSNCNSSNKVSLDTQTGDLTIMKIDRKDAGYYYYRFSKTGDFSAGNKVEIKMDFLPKGIATQSSSSSGSSSGSGSTAWDAAWNDSIDLYCTKHTKWHLKLHHQWQRSNQSQTHFSSGNASHCSGFILIQLYYCDVLLIANVICFFGFVNKNAANLKLGSTA